MSLEMIDSKSGQLTDGVLLSDAGDKVGNEQICNCFLETFNG